MKRLKVLLLFDSPVSRPRGYDFKEELQDPDWITERSTFNALVSAGHQVQILGLYNNIGLLIEEVSENKPDIIFNLAEVFNQKSHLDKNVAAVLELLDIPYTGASPATLAICSNKALTKKILSFHRIKIPHFYTFYRSRRIWLPKKLRLPLIVKPLSEEASRGISQASIVDNEESLLERVKFIHESMKNDAIVEEYIDGREFYVSILGDKRVKVLPLREVKFGDFAEDEPRIATYKAKWDEQYRQKWGIKNVFAGRLPDGFNEKIAELCKRAFRSLNMDCYGRFDLRLTADNKIYILEANANPSLDPEDELAQSAEKAGITYDKLIQKILMLGFGRRGA